MTIEIPNKVMEQIRLTPEQLKLEIAIYLYDKKRLTMGQAKRFAGFGQVAFQKELALRGIYIHFRQEDFQKDLDNLGLDFKS